MHEYLMRLQFQYSTPGLIEFKRPEGRVVPAKGGRPAQRTRTMGGAIMTLVDQHRVRRQLRRDGAVEHEIVSAGGIGPAVDAGGVVEGSDIRPGIGEKS